MFNVKDGLAFVKDTRGNIIILKDNSTVATLTQDDWISVVTHMASENRDLAEIHRMAEMLHTGEPGLKIDTPIGI